MYEIIGSDITEKRVSDDEVAGTSNLFSFPWGIFNTKEAAVEYAIERWRKSQQMHREKIDEIESTIEKLKAL